MSDTHDTTDLRWLLLGTALSAFQLLYLVSPIDLIPDVLPVVGWVDDLLGILGAATVTAYGAWRVWRHPAVEARVHDAIAAPQAAAPVDYEPVSAGELERW